MNTIQLVTGNKNYSSSSLRAWMCLQAFNIPFNEIKIDLFKNDSTENLAMYSPSLQVPVLIHNDIKVWDSLAICEYISETFLANSGWPQAAKKRAAARSIGAELHTDFVHFKSEWPMNCLLTAKMPLTEELEKEIARLDAIMYCCRRQHGDGGKYLFGRISIVDCIFAPLAISLKAYAATLSWKSEQYLQQLISNPHLKYWLHQAQKEINTESWKKQA